MKQKSRRAKNYPAPSTPSAPPQEHRTAERGRHLARVKEPPPPAAKQPGALPPPPSPCAGGTNTEGAAHSPGSWSHEQLPGKKWLPAWSYGADLYTSVLFYPCTDHTRYFSFPRFCCGRGRTSSRKTQRRVERRAPAAHWGPAEPAASKGW